MSRLPSDVAQFVAENRGSTLSRRITSPPSPPIRYEPDWPLRWHVNLWAGARDAIQFEARRYIPSSLRETGGWLLGRRNTDGRIQVQAATGPGVDSTRAVGRMTRRIADGEARARMHGLDLLGSWHTHPDGSRELSDDDKRTCAETLDAIRASATDRDTTYVELLVTPLEGGWGGPRITPYVFTFRRDGTALVERAEVKRP
jgi:proteasome lid subunit RPN8/RPN11